MISLKLVPLIVILLFVVYLAGLSFATRLPVVKAEDVRFLSPCPQKPNCVSSEAADPQQKIEAFALIDNDPGKSWQKLVKALREAGGEILVDDGQYCHAVFTSLLFRFKDDVEAVLNETGISVRSASRAGTSDLGANRKRVERIRGLYE